jgi:hypothetical protein
MKQLYIFYHVPDPILNRVSSNFAFQQLKI